MSPIENGSANPIGSPRTVLDVSDALVGTLRPLTVIPITKTVRQFGNFETPGSSIFCEGSLVPLPARELMIRPEGERAWSWWQLIVDRDIRLSLDDRAEIDGVPYRIRSKFDYSAYGFFEYHLLEDYTGDTGGNTMEASRAYQEVYFDGSTSVIQVDTSSQVPDATTAVWTLYAPDGTPVEGAVAPFSPSDVQITISPAPAPGTYRLVGIA